MNPPSPAATAKETPQQEYVMWRTIPGFSKYKCRQPLQAIRTSADNIKEAHDVVKHKGHLQTDN